VDILAKEGRNCPEIVWKDPRRPLWSALPVWNNLVIDMSSREFVKEVHIKETIVEWSHQNRIQKSWTKEIDEQSTHSWRNFWNQCRQGSSLQTSLKQAKERNFRIKLINEELPTLHNLQKRRSDLYDDVTCIMCKEEEENTEHIFSYTALATDRDQIWEEVRRKVAIKFSELVNKGREDNSEKEKSHPTNLMLLINQWESRTRNSSHDLINICLGLFSDQESQSWIRNAKEDGLRGSACQLILEVLSNSLLKLFRKRVWIPRCARTIAWEQAKGIYTKLKKKKIREKTSREETWKTSDTRIGGEIRKGKSREDRNRDQTRSVELIEKESGLKEKVRETVWGWVRNGRKWLGF
jgi:hypothetical protein